MVIVIVIVIVLVIVLAIAIAIVIIKVIGAERQTDRCHMAQKLLQRSVLLTEHQQKDWQ